MLDQPNTPQDTGSTRVHCDNQTRRNTPRPWSAPPLALQLLWLLVPCLSAQQPQNNAGFGGIYRTINIKSLTGSDTAIGCADLGNLTFISARDTSSANNHKVYAVNSADQLVATFSQPALHTSSKWGMRDLCTDGVHLAGGSEAGISILTQSGALATTWDGHPINQPITGSMLAAVGVPRGLAWDGSAGGGTGRFYAVNHNSDIFEFDTQGNITGSFPNAGWVGTGLAVDSRTGNLWVDGSQARGDLMEIDRAGGSGQPTGRRIPRSVPGALGGGLSPASTAANAHAPWPSEFCLLSLSQGSPDTLAVHRVHLGNNRPGWDDCRLEVSTNGIRLRDNFAQMGSGDTLELFVVAHAGAPNNPTTWTIFNFPPYSATDDLTDLTGFYPGAGILVEHRTHNAASITAPTNIFAEIPTAVGQVKSIPLPPSFPVASGMLLRTQAVIIDLSEPNPVMSTNEAFFQGSMPQTGILIEAVGANSFDVDPDRGFWRIYNLGGLGPIHSISLDWTQSTLPGQHSMLFDIDEDLRGHRHDAGNSTTCAGTYRNTSDIDTGLDYAYPGNHVSSCTTGTENAGFSIDVGTDAAAQKLTYRFSGNLFDAGKRLEFDCDTDGGRGVAGSAMAGLVVHVTLVDGTSLSGTLMVDPQDPLRAFTQL